ncbi:DUF2059 domain-containing protein [Lentisphaera profundi]|uniref:DUF2059 domain-containing protein n=1 Tax=Lentisphaera profundi TaxID=1658616 RepID=A0ABY7VYW3_9BACT|nr:DUF2059 domain-containing protein [Lentisphaera profundi]WDE97899.1 DUF2059 domain-containing protein [Lentisphaera profundi]
MKLHLTLLLFICTLFTSQADDAYTTTLSEFLQVSGVTAGHEDIVAKLAGQLGVSTDSSKYTKLLGEQISKLNNSLSPVYQKYVSEDDLKSLIKFFKSPVGEGFVKSQPQILEKSLDVVADWQSDLKSTLITTGSELLKKKGLPFSF